MRKDLSKARFLTQSSKKTLPPCSYYKISAVRYFIFCIYRK